MSSLPSWADAKRIGIDLECKDPLLKKLGPGVRRGGHVVGISFSIEDGPKHYLPIAHEGGDNLVEAQVWQYLMDQAREFRGYLVGANMQYDLDYLAEAGVWFERVKAFRDVQVADPLIDELHNSYSLRAIAERHGVPGKDEQALREAALAWGIDPKKEMYKLPARYVGAYAIQDADLPLRLLRRQERIIDEQGLWQIFDLESAVLPILVKMRRRGVAVDLDRLEQVEDWADERGAEHLALVKDETGVALKLDEMNDSDAVAKPLLELGIELDKTKQGKYSVDADLLRSIDHPVAKAINEAKQMRNVRCKFGNGIREHVVDGRIHCTFNQLRRTDEERGGDDRGARFGRLSSTDPNMQQQPARHPEIAPRWRSIYVPEDGMIWAANDYSQQEPRWLVHFAELVGLPKAGDAAERYRTDPETDNHQMMADMIGIKRKQAKEVFLGKCYGMGGGKLCRKLNLPTMWIHSTRLNKMIEVAGAEGDAIIKQFDRELPFVKMLANMCEQQAKQRGFIRTVLGRRCRFPVKANGEFDWCHKALNRLIQGSSADQTKAALVQIDAAGEEPQLQIHDEIDLSVRDKAHAERVAKIMRECVPANVPFKVDVEIGPSWGEAS